VSFAANLDITLTAARLAAWLAEKPCAWRSGKGAIDARSTAVIYCVAKGVSMKALVSRFCLVAAISLLGAGVAQAQLNIPNPSAPGASMDSAVRLVVTSDLMVDRQISRWLRTHYPGWDADPHEFTTFGDERYAVVYIQHKEHPSRRVYFRLLQSHADPDNQSPTFPL
jgi:hypothetical protein